MKKDFKVENKVNCLIIIIQQLIEGKKLTTKDISKIIDRDIRTSQRYIRNLIDMELPIKRIGHTYYYENDDGKVPFYLPKDSIYMIYLSLISFSAFGKDSEIITSILKQVEILLAPQDRLMLSNFKENIVVKNRNEIVTKNESIFRIFISLMYSFSRKKVINMIYRSKNGLKNHIFEIFGFCLAKETYYVAGKSDKSDSILTFRLDRIKEFYEENKEYVLPKDFNVKNHFEYAWEVEVSQDVFKFKLEFYKDALTSIKERKWCKDQVVIFISEEKALFEGKTTSERELKKWILGYGANIKVLEPTWLKESIINEYKNTLLNY